MNSRFKIVAVFLLLVLFGGSMYYAGQQEGFALIQQAQKKTVPEKTLITPEKVKNPVKVSLERDERPNPRYTFFEVLDDPNMKSYVDLDGNVVHEPVNHAIKKPAPSLAKEVKEKPRIQEQERTQKQTKTRRNISEPQAKSAPAIQEKVMSPLESLKSLEEMTSTKDRHWVQVASFKEEDRAKGLEIMLRKKGFSSFVEGRGVPDKGTWYRVYLGSYESRMDAENAAGKLAKDSRWKPMVVKPN